MVSDTLLLHLTDLVLELVDLLRLLVDFEAQVLDQAHELFVFETELVGRFLSALEVQLLAPLLLAGVPVKLFLELLLQDLCFFLTETKFLLQVRQLSLLGLELSLESLQALGKTLCFLHDATLFLLEGIQAFLVLELHVLEHLFILCQLLS